MCSLDFSWFNSGHFVDVIEWIGTFAFAISGIRLAAKKDFDLFGAYVVGLLTAIGGGTIRDLLLQTNPFWMSNSRYMICTAVALLFVILFRKHIVKLNITFFIFDTIGLALFTVVGIEKTLGFGHPFWVAAIMGTITGVAGGVLRDICIAEIPLIFRKEIYASSCLLGCLCYYICNYIGISLVANQLLTSFVIILSRVIAVKNGIGLPKLKSESD
ncbi:MAG: trimeric intracellular cation channel family protein [Bacteroidales bacterium]|nr:trimeric intracellular cation channel family protein [Candidatus Physcocola equi]